MDKNGKEFHIAPMIDVSTVEFRYFIRLLTKRAVIWNQMVVAETLVFVDRGRRHKQNTRKERSSCELPPSFGIEHENDTEVELNPDLIKHCGWYDGSVEDDVHPNPTVCQIGTNNPTDAAFATRIAQKCGYDSIDLNCGCPSDRVRGKCFGAELMKDQDTAVKIVESLVKTAQSLNTPMPVSVKTRIGVDEDTGFDFIAGFIQRLVDAGCNNFVLHARNVHSEGLSPAQNRTIPPLDYPLVYRLVKYFPQCSFLINGGILSLDHAKKVAFGCITQDENDGNGIEEISASADLTSDHAVPCQRCNLPNGSCLRPPKVSPPNLRGVMVGRLARDRPADLADVDRFFFGEPSNPCYNRRHLMDRYISFLEKEYPRRCCDDGETITLDMMMYLPMNLAFRKHCCSICEEFRGRNEYTVIKTEKSHVSEASNLLTAQRTQSSKRSKRHSKYKGAKIVTRIIDRALQPTWGILAGEVGKTVFRRVSHELSRDVTVRNCGPGYILWKAMQSIPPEIWDKPFELGNEQSSTFYPTN